MLNKILLIGAVLLFPASPAFPAEWAVINQQLDAYEHAQAAFTAPVQGMSAFSGTMLAPSANIQRKHEFLFGVEHYAYKYSETVQGEDFMSNKGHYNGYYFDYAFRPPELSDLARQIANAFRVELRLASGSVDYSASGSGSFDGLKDYMYEARGLVEKEYDLSRALMVSHYFGLGWRYLNNHLDAFQPGGYDRESRYFYLPIGLHAYYRLPGAWGVGGALEYDYLLTGWQTSHLEDVEPGFSAVTNEQNKGFGIRGSLKVVKELRRVRLSLEPFYRYWHIESSSVEPVDYNNITVGFASEPENITQEIGLKMGAQF